MKPRRARRACRFLNLAFQLSCGIALSQSLAAAQWYWNPGGTGGDGNWGTSPGDKNWNTVPAAPAGNTFWQDSVDDSAVFQDAIGGTVTVFDPVQTHGISQNGADYTINAGTITLTRDAALAGPFIDVQTGELGIDSILDGTAGLIKSGAGTLMLTSDNVYTGETRISAGTLTLAGSIASASVNVEGGAAFINQAGGLTDAVELTNAGTVTMNSADTVTRYIQNGNGLLGGSAALTATGGATLNGGTVSGSLLGNVTSSGDVLVSGSIGGGNLSLTGGILTLSGTSANSLVDISAPATLRVTHSGLDSAAALTNAGTLTMDSADTVASYVQNGNGLLGGSAALTATGGATLNGGTVSGSLLGNVTSTADVLVSGSIGAGSLSVTGGQLHLTGVSNHLDLSIASGASLLDAAGGLNSVAAVSSSGTMTVNADDEVSTYQQFAGGTLAGTADLTVSGGAVLYGGTVSGSLKGNIVTHGDVLVSGKVSEGSLSVLAGNLVLGGISESMSVSVASGASLLDTNGGLDSGTYLINSGTLTLQADDHVLTYLSNGGTLATGAGVLSAANATLNDSSTISGRLTAASLISNGDVAVTGSAIAQSILISSGTLTNTGVLGSNLSRIDIHSGATLVAAGREQFSTLITSGSGTGTWRGDLKNSTAVAPGDNGNFGALMVDGDFRQSPAGLLQIDLSGSGNDLLAVTGNARFKGTLALHQIGGDFLTPYAPVQVVDAASYTGNFTTLSEDLDGAVWFNPGNGTVMLLTSGGDLNQQFPGAGRNQISTWTSLYDDVIDPGVTNITQGSGNGSGLQIESGIADVTNPDLMWALEASFTPKGLNSALLNRLSPEVYASFNDYAVQATRSHLRSALNAPTLPVITPGATSKSGMNEDSKSPSPQPASARDWEFFAAADYFDASTDNSPNQADYALTGSGILSGAKTRLNTHTLIAGYVAFDTGSIDGELIDADQIGWSLGVFGRSVLNERSQTVLTAALTHGRYEFDGSRESAIADASGWRPGDVDFSNVDGFSTELFLGIESRFKAHERIRLIPSAGFRAAFATMDGFTESTSGTAGSPIALSVERDHQEYLLAECGLTAETDINDRLIGWAHLGFSAGIGEDPHVLQARFDQGSRPMRITADGLSDDLILLGLGARYQVSDSVGIHFGYHADLNSGESTVQGFNVSTSYRF